MSRTPARFTQADIARVLRAVAQCGLDAAVELGPDGVIRIVKVGAPTPQVDETREIAL
jgi:hypothetical protein